MHVTLELDFLTQGRLPLFCCLVAFIVTFFITRTIVRYIRSHADSDAPRKWWQPRNIGHGTLHIHHMVIGVILVMVSGISMVTLGLNGGVPEFTVAATFFGIGAALVLDEFALILHLQDVYWAEDGRTSVDAVFAAIAVAGLLMIGLNPLSFFDVGIWRDDHTLAARASVIAIAVLTLGLALIVLLKGKVWTGLVGMFITPLLFVGAIRLSRPHAPWARWRYTDKPRKMHRALVRERIAAQAGGAGQAVVAARRRRRAAFPRRPRGEPAARPGDPCRPRASVGHSAGCPESNCVGPA